MLFVAAVLLAIFVLDSPWGAVAVGLAGVVELSQTAFWIRRSKRKRVQVGAEAMIGARAEVVSTCRPSGQVRIEGELWQARCPGGADPGEHVRVLALEGLTLLVESED